MRPVRMAFFCFYAYMCLHNELSSVGPLSSWTSACDDKKTVELYCSQRAARDCVRPAEGLEQVKAWLRCFYKQPPPEPIRLDLQDLHHGLRVPQMVSWSPESPAFDNFRRKRNAITCLAEPLMEPAMPECQPGVFTSSPAFERPLALSIAQRTLCLQTSTRGIAYVTRIS
jgi:hypothetical protein